MLESQPNVALGAPPQVPLNALSAEGLEALRSFEVGLRCIDSSSACIQGLAAALVHAANTPAVHHLIAAIERQIETAAAATAAPADAAAATTAAAAAAGGAQLVLLLYVLNDVLQRCCSCGLPFLLQLCCNPLKSLCMAAAAAAAETADKRQEVKRVLLILRQRGTFGTPEICDALLKILAGQPADVPPVPYHYQQQQQQLLQQQQQQQQQRPGLKAAEQVDAKHGPQTLDGYRLHYPAASDAATAAAADAATPTTPAEEAFQQQLQRSLAIVKDCTLTIKDAQDSRKRQNARVVEMQQTLQRLAMGQDPEQQATDYNSQQTYLTNAKARIARLYEKEWNKTVQLQETFLLLAQKIEEKLQDALLQHVKCREAKLNIDRAIAERRAGAARSNP